MKASFTNSDRVFLSGENPYMMLFNSDEETATALVSLWRVRFSAAGEGTALFVRSDITGDRPRVFTNNVDVARFLQVELFARNQFPFGEFADENLPVELAEFKCNGDSRWSITEEVTGLADRIVLNLGGFPPRIQGMDSGGCCDR